jgi:D-beta-D-heptose 7-phosphate kinase/D-beta-D-heptose 1-phosphate adenosyltransferase
LSKALSCIVPRTILVVGDLILDKYTFGSSQRISPEAPVPIILVDREEYKAGGAGNVALNLIAMGMRVRLIGRIGADLSGRHLIDSLEKEGVDISGVIEEPSHQTPTKNRIIASSQQLVRVDNEVSSFLSAKAEFELINRLPSFFSGIDLVAISDYAKGTLSLPLLRAVIETARRLNIPCITDPKSADFSRYSGSTIIKPNASETFRAAPPGSLCLENAAFSILKNICIDVLMVTRSEDGISLFYPDGRQEHFPVPRKEVRDVTGAGDTVLAMISAAYASGLPLSEVVPLANVAASCAVERFGCARISLHDIASRLLEENPSGKICSADTFQHLFGALQHRKLLFINISSPDLTPYTLLQIAQTAQQYPDRHSIACFTGKIPDQSMLELIASLKPLHLVVHSFSNSLPFTPTEHNLSVTL